MKEFIKDYRGYTIRKIGNELNIYDNLGCYLNKIENPIIRNVEKLIDKHLLKEIEIELRDSYLEQKKSII